METHTEISRRSSPNLFSAEQVAKAIGADLETVNEWLDVCALDRAVFVVKRLPKHNGEFEYQIKSVSGIDERIVRESQLKPSPWRNQAGRPYSA